MDRRGMARRLVHWVEYVLLFVAVVGAGTTVVVVDVALAEVAAELAGDDAGVDDDATDDAEDDEAGSTMGVWQREPVKPALQVHTHEG